MLKISRMHRTIVTLGLLTAVAGGCDDKKATKDGADKPAASAVAKKKDGETKTAPGKVSAKSARAHLAKGCDVVAYFNVGGWLSSPPIKKHLVPAFEEAYKKEAKSEKHKNFKAFLSETGIDPLKDIQEVAICVTNIKKEGGEPDFSMIASGKLKQGSVVPALLKTATKKDKMVEAEVGGVKVLTDKKKDMFLGQAKDGVFILAKGKSAFESALGTTDAATAEYKLDGKQTMSVVVPAGTIKFAMEKGGADNPFKDVAAKAGRAAISVDMASGALEIRISMADEKAAIELGGVVKMLMGQFTKGKAQGPQAIFQEAAKAAKIENQGKDLVLTTKTPLDQLDKSAKQLAEMIRGELK